MMTTLLFLWSSVIPGIPLMLAHRNIISAATIGLLLLSTLALWFERDRHPTVSKPIDFGSEERLAA